jgi:hypothetical protein
MQKLENIVGMKGAAYAAAAWSFVFAAMSFYWAAGGLIGAETLGDGIKALALARDSELLTLTWITGGLKVIAGLLALSLVQSWGRIIPRRLRLIGAWGAAVLFLLYGIGNLIQHALIAIGTAPIPNLLGSMNAVRWHLFFWDPFWIVGGILFALAARSASRPPG